MSAFSLLSLRSTSVCSVLSGLVLGASSGLKPTLRRTVLRFSAFYLRALCDLCSETIARETWAEAHATGGYAEVLKRKERAE